MQRRTQRTNFGVAPKLCGSLIQIPLATITAAVLVKNLLEAVGAEFANAVFAVVCAVLATSSADSAVALAAFAEF